MAKVMIIEDDQTSIRLLRILLEEVYGYALVFARTGADALTQAPTNNPDLFLVDYRLSDTDGITLIRKLRGMPEFATTPIIMASGMDVEEQALAAGASRFLIKPYEPSALATLFQELMKPA
ncbi:MAG: response regulator [Anaerolineae bacterium]|nr:response regulator [Anaerolineae bacterium]